MPSLFYAGQPDYIEKLNTLATAASMTNGTVAASFLSLAVTGTATAASFVGPLTGNASTATTLATARNINGVSFNGSADITVTAAAGTLTGTTLAANVVNASLNSIVPTGGALSVTGSFIRHTGGGGDGYFGAGTALVSGAATGTMAVRSDYGDLLFSRTGTEIARVSSSGLSVTGSISATGGVYVGDGTQKQVVIARGPGSGVNDGAAFIVQNGGSSVIALGNKSALLGGAYNATPLLYGNAAIEVNQALNVTGSISATTRVNYPSFTVATLPAVGSAGGNIYVSDESGGAQPAFSDGTNWRRYTDRAVVS
jgi:hypothetical protein